MKEFELTQKYIDSDNWINNKKMTSIIDIENISQYWNSALLLYQLTHYYDINNILDKINIDY